MSSAHSQLFTFLRHARSFHNELTHQLARKLPPNIHYRNSQEFIKIKLNKDLMDCSISAQGARQCRATAEQINAKDFDLIVVSPMRRALQTCHHIFKDKGIPIKVEPLISQKFSSACDIGSRIEDSIRDFRYMDFKNLRKGWYLNYLSRSKAQKISQLQKKMNSIDEATFHVLKQAGCLESMASFRKRANKAKSKLMKYQRASKKRILVISHGFIINELINSALSQSQTHRNAKHISNCQLIDMRIHNWQNRQQKFTPFYEQTTQNLECEMIFS